MRRLLTIVSCLVLVSTLMPLGIASAYSPTDLNASVSSVPSQVELQTSADPRYFPETGFRISNDKFWDYFNKRGGLRTFGYPVSREFTLLGSQVQFFQRRILQIQPDGSVGQLNLFDQGLMPYTSINFTTIPAVDQNLVSQAPNPADPNYGTAVLNFVRNNTADVWQTMRVNFYQTFANSVKLSEAYPNGGGNAGLMSLINFEMWGIPTAGETLDPNNHNFVYKRFQRGVMHYDKTSGQTQGLLLADYFKFIITGSGIPADLDAQARTSPFYKQYNNANANGLNRPELLPNTNMKDAFEKQGPTQSNPTPPPSTPAPNPQPTSGLRYGMQAHMYFQDQPRILSMITGAGFGWLKQQIRWESVEPQRGQIDWGNLDPIVNNASAAGVKVLFSVVTCPSWARADQRHDGPPDNYADLGNFIAAMAARYRGRVHAYEVWNEQNFSREWGGGTINPGGYVELLKAVYPRVKQADPNALVISGALTPTGVMDPSIAMDDLWYLEQMYAYQGGVLKTVCDGIGAHMAGYNNAPEDWVDYHTVNTPGFKEHPSFYFRRIDQLHDVMARYGDNKQMWITEYEWASAAPPVPAGYEWTTHLSEQQVADFLVRSMQSIRTQRPWVGAVFVWNLNWRTFSDPHTNECALFGILNGDWSPRIIYAALRDMPK